MAKRKKRAGADIPASVCYMPMQRSGGKAGRPDKSNDLQRLLQRLLLLEDNAMGLASSLAALRTALHDIAQGCVRLNDPARRGQLTPEEMAQAAALAARVQQALAALAGR